jgi:cytoskeletal protein CcmA (bactofilin family)
MERRRTMLRKSSNNTQNRDQHIDTLIGAHSTIVGDLTFEGSVRIDGKFNGNINSTKEGTLIISEGAVVTGEIQVPNLVLHGTINGNVVATVSLKVGTTGLLNGDVEYKVISLAEGCAINGRCKHVEENSKKGAAHQQPKNKSI